MFGLVLEGGGTKGAYHIGAYKAICELGIAVDCIVGASIGAINGALFAQGDWEMADSMWENISAEDVIALPEETADVENVLDIKNVQAFYKEIVHNKGLDTTPLEKLLRSVINEDKLRESQINFGLVTFNITGVKEHQIFIKDIPRGKLVDYLLASSALPIFKPKKIDDSVFIDGAVTNNLPVDMMINAGYTDVITVEVGGIGKSKWISGAGCNIISVKSGTGNVKTLDFSKNSILEAKLLGYNDAMRAFGKITGEKFYFETGSYTKAKLKYSEKILHGLELAAGIYDLNRLKIYTVEELISEVIAAFKNTTEYDSVLEVLKKGDREKTTALARAMLKSDSEMLEKGTVAGILGNIFDAASTVAYFIRKDI